MALKFKKVKTQGSMNNKKDLAQYKQNLSNEKQSMSKTLNATALGVAPASSEINKSQKG